MPVGFTAAELAIWTDGQWTGNEPRKIRGISKDTRTIRRGDIYIALKGENFDGHEFVDIAAAKGASGLIVSSESGLQSMTGLRSSVPMLVVSDTRKALIAAAREYREKVDPYVIGVTGSAGKSTVKEMIIQMLATTYRTAGTTGNYNNDIGLPLSILAMEIDTEKAVFEIGTNHPGEILRLARIMRPNCAIVTNVGPAHIGNFGGLDDIASEKADLVRSLGADGLAVLNLEDEYCEYMTRLAPEDRVFVSGSENADYSFVRIKETGKVLVKENFSGEEVIFSSSLSGRYNLLNSLQAIAAARRLGVGWKNIKKAMENFRQLSMRWEEVKMDEISMINDAYNANPLSMRASITAFEEKAVHGDKWLVLGSMAELGTKEQTEHVSLGEFVGEGEWAGVVLVGGCGDLMARGIQTTGYDASRIFVCVNNREAAEILERNIQNGDAVLLKGSRALKLEEVIDRVQDHLE
jgi:UDP-N-acetylmuramoyl-tripeptide--D-alanyl-D-alanine ligase